MEWIPPQRVDFEDSLADMGVFQKSFSGQSPIELFDD